MRTPRNTKETTMPKITPHLWFDTQAREAADFYVSVFDNSRVKRVTTLGGTPSGSVDIVDLELCGQAFMFLAAGPLFKVNPSISFLVSCATKTEVDALWGKLSDGGKALMELGAYPFSERYGWTEDRYGVSWQVMFAGDRPIGQKITPTLMFTGKQAGNAEEAIRFYASTFPGSRVGDIVRYNRGEEPDTEGTVRHAQFQLGGQQFAAMDSARSHGFAFNEAISLLVRCETQEEIDELWGRLSADPKAEQCGWLKDRYGLSWQITPTAMDEMMATRNPEKRAAVTAAFLKMKKFDVAKLKAVYDAA
jgi:predicted 3-demethylubiquinone-9 3-methyltransferase (glyoxalase superfamily)